MPLEERVVIEDLLQHRRLLVRVALRAVDKDIWSIHRDHLQLLYLAHTSMWIQTEDIHVARATDTGDGRRASVPAGFHDDVAPFSTLGQQIIDDFTHDLLADVLEGQRWPQRRVEEVEVVEVVQRQVVHAVVEVFVRLCA